MARNKRKGKHPEQWKRLWLSEEEAQNLVSLLGDQRKHQGLVTRLKQVLDEFADGTQKLKELVATARADGFWTDDPSGNLVKELRAGQRRQMKDLTKEIAHLSAEEVKAGEERLNKIREAGRAKS